MTVVDGINTEVCIELHPSPNEYLNETCDKPNYVEDNTTEDQVTVSQFLTRNNCKYCCLGGSSLMTSICIMILFFLGFASFFAVGFPLTYYVNDNFIILATIGPVMYAIVCVVPVVFLSLGFYIWGRKCCSRIEA